MPGDFISLVEADSGVVAIAGASSCYAVFIPQQILAGPNKRPCIVHRTSAVEIDATFCGHDDLVREQMSFDCCAVDYDTAVQLGQALKAAILDLKTVSGGTEIMAVRFLSEFDDADGEPGIYRRHIDVNVWHRSTSA